MQLLTDKTVLTGLLAVVLALLAGALRPGSAESGLYQYGQHALKATWGAQFDLVVTGNSRVERGVSPAAMGDVLTGTRIANLGMAGTGLSADYLSAARQLLDPASTSPATAIGVSPGALVEANMQRNAFIEARSQQPVELWLVREFGGLARLFSAYSRSELKQLAGLPAPTARQVNHADGWSAFYNMSSATASQKLANYRKLFEYEQVSRVRVAELLATVGRWSSAGITVYGFRPPAGPKMTALEDGLSGLDMHSFAQEFKAAGGVWLEIDQAAYSAPDNSHLEAGEAQRFSRDLAAAIAAGSAQGAR